MNLAGHTTGVLWTVVPAAIGAITGKLSNKFSAESGFIWGAVVGAVFSFVRMTKIALTVANWKKFEKTEDFRYLHDNILKKADVEIATEKETSGNHVQKVVDSRRDIGLVR
jgi:hypothetical protein